MMDIESLKIAANDGDVEAMLQLAGLYVDNNEIIEATEWSDKAAEKGNIEANYRSMILHNAQYALDKQLGFWNKLNNDATIARERAEFLLRLNGIGAIKLNEDILDKITECLQEAQYELAVSIYAEDDGNVRYGDILQLIEDSALPKAKMLLGLYAGYAEDVANAYEYLVSAYKDDGYCRSTKGIMEEAIFADAMLMLANIYRTGYGVVIPSIDAAAEVQMFLVENLKDEDFRKSAEQEMARYKKKLFGGYKYTG